MVVMEKKGVLGLSIETLVVIIISLVVLAGGISLLYKFIGGAQEIKADLDERTKAEIERIILDEGKPVVLPFHTATVFRGENHVFGIGILNIGLKDENDPNVPINKQFTLQVTPKNYIDANGQATNLDPNGREKQWLLYNDQVMTIQVNEHRTESILVSVPTAVATGQYIFDAVVIDVLNNQQYGNVQKFYVTVK